jgi:NAD-dependent dihydropyrimidine dehydrogenase PreA subunit
MGIIVDIDKCTGCGKCYEVCPKGPRIWKIENQNGSRKASIIDEGYCINCSTCASFCPAHAIKINWQ